MDRKWCAGLAVLVWSGAFAQWYPDSDPRSPNHQQYQQRQNEERQQQEKDDEAARKRDSENFNAFMANQHKLQEKISGEVERDRAMFLKTPPVPPQKNRLLGQWRLDRTKEKPANAIAELNAMISQPACEMVFGDGIWDFRLKALYGIDAGIGETMLTEVAYHGNEGVVGVIPRKGKLFVFKILGPDGAQELTSTRIGADPCNFVRVGARARGASAPGTAPQAANSSSSGGPPAASGRAQASPPAQVASSAPTGSTLSRPPPEVCRNTLIDKLGTVGVNQVRAISAAGAPPSQMANAAPTPPPSTPSRPSQEVCNRTFLDKLGVATFSPVRKALDTHYKETLQGTVPNSQLTRLDARGSACDDPRIQATLYDFDANGVLQSITLSGRAPPDRRRRRSSTSA